MITSVSSYTIFWPPFNIGSFIIGEVERHTVSGQHGVAVADCAVLLPRHLFEDAVLVLCKPDRDGVIHWQMRLVVWCSEGLGVRG